MRYVFGFLCVCALGVLPLVGCGGIESESCGTGGPGWFSQCSPTSYVLNDVSFTDANTGTAVGGGGTILRTTDGGVTWVEQNSGTTDTLRAVSFVDANTGTAVGESGTILRTTDGGATWVTQQSFLPPIPDLDRDLLDVSFIDANAGMAVGRAGRTWDGLTRGICLGTTDGGATWWLLDVPARRDFTGVSITDAHVTIIGGDFIVRINAGDIIPFDTVKAQVLQFRDEDLFDVSFTDANTGTVVGRRGTILRTTDGGTTWTAHDSGTSHDLWGVSFADVNTGTVVGRRGTILRTTDGGVTWVEQSSGTENTLWAVSFVDANTGTAVGESGTILRTTDGGGTGGAGGTGGTGGVGGN